MTSLLKNQILKHLSRFTKNLSPDKISLSALRGEGELANLELDETVLMDILELPTWLRLSKAVCNRVGIKIQWTKLKTQPICLYLDEVVLEVETCEELRPPNNPQVASLRPGKYGFVERVIDGIYVHINSVQVFFLSKTFQACLQMSRVKVHSVSPTWHATTDLRLTRIKDVSRGEVIIFKEVDWQATRIEAQAVDPHSKGIITQTPIRLIANQAKLRIAVKKNINDCSIVSSRVILLLDDLLWVLTETQLKAALLYATSLQEVFEKSTLQSKQRAAEKLKKQGHISSDQLKKLQQIRQNKQMPASKVSRVFAKFDVLSTSYHLITSRIDLHLCDDMQPRNDSTPSNTSRIEGGAMQITLNKLSVDYYPFNPAGGERKQWYRYSDQVGSRNHWVGQLFAHHKEEVRRAKMAYSLHSPSQSPTHLSEQAANSSSSSSTSSSTSSSGATSKSQASPTVPHVGDKSPGSTSSSTTPSQGRPPPSGSGSGSGGGGRTTSRLLESCMVLEIEEFTIYCISTADQKRNNPHKFFSSEKKVLHLPHDMPIIHLEFTEYYFPEGIDFPVPHANLYALVNPVQLRIDYLTLLWLNYFLLQLSKNLKECADCPREHVDIKVEALMPKILIHADAGSHHHSSEHPDTLLIQMSKISATNNRSELHASRDKLLSALNEQSKSYLYKSSDFPMDDNVNTICPQQVCAHALSKDAIDAYIDPEVKRILTSYKLHLPQTDHIPAFPTGPDGERLTLGTNSLRLDSAYDVWNVEIDQIWMDFTTRRSRPVPFVESFPVTLWFWRTLPAYRSETNLGGHKDGLKNGDVTSDRSSTQESGCSGRGKKKMDDDLSLSSPRSSTSSRSRDRSESPPVGGSASSSRSSSSDRNQPLTDTAKLSAPRCVLSGKRKHMDIYAIACVRTKVQVLLTHYQYLFVLRLMESLSAFQKQFNTDTEYFSENSIYSSISLTSIVHDVEVAMIFQKASESNNHSGNLSGAMKGSIAQLPTMDKDSATEGWNNAESETRDDSIGYISKSYSDSRLNLSKQDIMNGGELQMQSAQMDSLRTSDLSLESNGQLAATLNSSSTHSLNPSVAYSSAADAVYATTTSGFSSDGKPMGVNLGMRKGSLKAERKKTLSSAWSNFTDKIRSMGELNDDLIFGSEDSEPGQTDYSSDDESFEHLSLEDTEETPAFERKGKLDPQGSFDSMSHDSSSETLSTAREKLQIHVTVFHLSEVEVLGQTFGVGSVLRAQLNNIDIVELTGLTWEGFHRKFTSSQGVQYDSVSMSDKQFPVKLKYMIGPGLPALKYDVIGQERGFLHVNLADMRLTFQMSTLINLADLLEDELPPVFMPLYINIEDITLTLQEDRQSDSSPMTPPPTVLSLHQAIIDRGADGVFHIRGANNVCVKRGVNGKDKTDDKKEEQISASHCAAISNSNRIMEQLWKRNTELEKIVEEMKVEASQKLEKMEADLVCQQTENEQLRCVSEKYLSMLSDGFTEQKTHLSAEHVEAIERENLKLLERISFLEEEVQTSNKEKDSLLATMHLLQEELLVSEQQRFQHQHSPNQ